MEPAQQRAVLTICLMAAFADGNNDDREREAIQRVADSLGSAGQVAAIYQDVMLRKPDLATVAAALRTPEDRKLAYESAVGVCNADGAASPAEREFLARLAQVLNVPAESAQQ